MTRAWTEGHGWHIPNTRRPELVLFQQLQQSWKWLIKVKYERSIYDSVRDLISKVCQHLSEDWPCQWLCQPEEHRHQWWLGWAQSLAGGWGPFGMDPGIQTCHTWLRSSCIIPLCLHLDSSSPTESVSSPVIRAALKRTRYCLWHEHMSVVWTLRTSCGFLM